MKYLRLASILAWWRTLAKDPSDSFVQIRKLKSGCEMRIISRRCCVAAVVLCSANAAAGIMMTFFHGRFVTAIVARI